MTFAEFHRACDERGFVATSPSSEHWQVRDRSDKLLANLWPYAGKSLLQSEKGRARQRDPQQTLEAVCKENIAANAPRSRGESTVAPWEPQSFPSIVNMKAVGERLISIRFEINQLLQELGIE